MIEREKDTTVVTDRRESNPLSALALLLLGLIAAFLLFNYLGDNNNTATPNQSATQSTNQNQSVPTEQPTTVPTTSTTASPVTQ